jgi:dTDP-4-amino-4,6-dideoxygalactose transaminase
MFKKIPIISSCALPRELLVSLINSGNKNLPRDFISGLKQACRCQYIYLTNSGISAYYIILKALKKNSRCNEVILPAYSAGSLVVATRKAGLKPVLCDICLKDYSIDLGKLQSIISQNSLAVVTVHLFGLISSEIKQLRNKVPQDVWLVEDCAQGMDTTLDGAAVGNLQDISFFSFNRGKNLALGKGGCIATNLEQISREIDLIYNQEAKDCSQCQNYRHFFQAASFYLASHPWIYGLGYPLIRLFKETAPAPDFAIKKISGFTAALGLELLEKIDTFAQNRYNKALYLSRELKDQQGIIIPEVTCNSLPAFNRFPILFQDLKVKDKVARKLCSLGIETSGMYLQPLHRMFNLGYKKEEFPNANFIAEHLLTFPVHSRVKDGDLERIVKTIRSLA